MHRHVTPVVAVFRVLVIVEILNGHDLHVGDAQLDEMVDAGRDRGIVRECRAALGQPEILALLRHAGIGRDGEIAHVHLVDDRVNRRIGQVI
jgi:hypothetical protein